MLKFFERLKIRYICRKMGIYNYKINDDLSIDTNQDVLIRPLSKLNWLLNIMIGDCFEEVNYKGSSNFSQNEDTKFVYKKIPIKFGKALSFYCANNKLESFENFPDEIRYELIANNNNISSLKGLPLSKGVYVFELSGNNIKSFEDAPRHLMYFDSKFKVLRLNGNPISGIWNHLNISESYIELFNEYDIIRGDEVILFRFNQFLLDNGKPELKKHKYRMFKGYKLII